MASSSQKRRPPDEFPDEFAALSGTKRVKAMASDQATITMDTVGDLVLVIGAGDTVVRFLVCSRTLSRYSPVFRRMLHGNWAESRTTVMAAEQSQASWTVRLPDDSPGGFRRILGAIHSTLRDTTTAIFTVDEAYDVCVVVNKYDMPEAMEPWVKQFSQFYERGVSSPKLLFIAKEIGDWIGFQFLCRILAAFGSCVKPPGGLCLQGIDFRSAEISPEAATFDRIKDARAKTIITTVRVLRDRFRFLLEDYGPICGHDACREILIGKFVSAAQEQGLLYLVMLTSEDFGWEGSLFGLLDKIGQLEILTTNENCKPLTGIYNHFVGQGIHVDKPKHVHSPRQKRPGSSHVQRKLAFPWGQWRRWEGGVLCETIIWAS